MERANRSVGVGLSHARKERVSVSGLDIQVSRVGLCYTSQTRGYYVPRNYLLDMQDLRLYYHDDHHHHSKKYTITLILKSNNGNLLHACTPRNLQLVDNCKKGKFLAIYYNMMLAVNSNIMGNGCHEF